MMIMMQANILVSLINDQLDIKLVEEGQFYSQKQTFSVTKLFAFIAALFKPQNDLFNNQMTVEVDESNVPENLFGDQVRLKQVLISILINAIKHTKDGKINVSVSYDAIRRHLTCAVSDTGAGFGTVKQDLLSKVLAKPQQAQDAHLNQSNVSLYICKMLVEKSGGALSAHSDGEKLGATFKFSMKMRELNELENLASDSSTSSDEVGDPADQEVSSFSDTHRSDFMSVFN